MYLLVLFIPLAVTPAQLSRECCACGGAKPLCHFVWNRKSLECIFISSISHVQIKVRCSFKHFTRQQSGVSTMSHVGQIDLIDHDLLLL